MGPRRYEALIATEHFKGKTLADQAAFTAVSEVFAKRLDLMKQGPKFSDVWPIRNIWGIIKERGAKRKCENLVNSSVKSLEFGEVWMLINRCMHV